MAVYLQSFFTKGKGKTISVARWQPKGFEHPTLNYLVPKRRNGTDIKGLPPKEYMEEYCKEVLIPNKDKLLKLYNRIREYKDDITFCCWCNAKRQKDYDKLFCHTILIGYLIEKFVPEVEVIYLEGRDNPIWSREEFYKCMGLER